jgi:diadenosine tetraphosphatase ApaH/serine/threonine PP2A family protein phosphatase
MPFAPRAGVAIPVSTHRRWVATIGSVGQPRDGDTRAGYALLDTDAKMLSFHRVAYDHLGVVRDMRVAGLPEVLASRLESGR